jgi:1-acyl-sn-glycerol-3-phosphate acyltransferase
MPAASIIDFHKHTGKSFRKWIEELHLLTYPDSNQPAPDRRDQKTYYFQATRSRKVLIATFEAIYRTCAKLEIEGAEKLPAEGPVILAANHLSNYDVFPLQFALPRTIFFMGKEELFRNPIMDWLLRQLGGFPVYRGERDEWAVRHAQSILEHGQVLGMFPEGSRSQGIGLRPAKTGIARLAQASQAPIVPGALHGPQYMFRRFPRRTPVQVRFGDPICPQAGETHLSLTDRVMFALAELLPPESRGVYRFRPEGF